MNNEEVLNNLSDIIVAIAAIATVLLAWRGLKTWQDELRGKAGYEAAYQYLLAALKLRREIQYIRSPVQSLLEEDVAYFKEHGIDPEDFISDIPTVKKPAMRAWYHFRWQPISQALQELEAAALDAEAVLGEDAIQEMQTFWRLIAELHTAMRRHLNSITETDSELRKEIHQAVDAVIDSSGDDDFTNRLNNAIHQIRVRLQQHLG